jgi:hypothetical protein
VLPTLEQEENKIGDRPTESKRSSAVFFIVAKLCSDANGCHPSDEQLCIARKGHIKPVAQMKLACFEQLARAL